MKLQQLLKTFWGRAFQATLKQDTQLCVTSVPGPALFPKPDDKICPNKGKDLMGQLEDPLGKAYTRANPEHCVVPTLLQFMLDSLGIF